MTELVTIPISTFELSVDYTRPEFAFSSDRGRTIHSVFDALKPWDPRIADVEVISEGPLSRQGVTVKLPLKGVSFFFGVASCKFVREGVDWQSAGETMTILDALLVALAKMGVVPDAINTAVFLHLQPKSLPFLTLLAPFVPAALAKLHAGKAVTMASVMKWEDRKITIDGSGILANAVFLCLERCFGGSTSLQQISAQLRKDQDEVFALLGVEEDRP